MSGPAERQRAADLQKRLGIAVYALQPGYAIVDYDGLDRLAARLHDIHMQATRKDRASGLKRYLVTDLEIIAGKAAR